MSYTIFTLSPGSTSTKLAVFKDDQQIFKTNVMHDPEVLKSFKEIKDQMPYRKETILSELEKAGIVSGYHARIAMRAIAPIATVLMEVTLGAHRQADFERYSARFIMAASRQDI